MEQSQNNSSNTVASNVSRKIGRCILRLQQYELLLKRIIANQELAGYADTLEANRKKRNAEVSKKTLGQLVGDLTNSYLSTEEDISQDQAEEEISELDPTRAYFRGNFSLEMKEERYQAVKESLAQMVALRNELVHHFLERFDLSRKLDRYNAERYLDEVYQTIDDRFRELRDWAKSMDTASKMVAGFMNSPEFQQFVIYGVFPGLEIHWPNTPIIHQLLAAEREYNENGWTPLDKAIKFIYTKQPDLTPKIYGCNSWRHVIHESKLFQIQKRKNSDNDPRQIWYRSRSSAT